jgi:acetyl-CoA C-acetyltransferase
MSSQPFLDYHARDGFQLGNREVMDGTQSLITDPWRRHAMGVTAENVAIRYNISRLRQDEFALASQTKAIAAQDSGIFAEEIIPVEIARKKETLDITSDSHIRRGLTLEKLARLQPVFRQGGSVTAGNSSGINDGGAAMVLTTGSNAKKRGFTPLACILGFAKSGIDPDYMGYGPVEAIQRVLRRNCLSMILGQLNSTRHLRHKHWL